MFYVTYNMQSSTTLLLLAGGFKGLMVYATFNIVLVIYRTCAIGRGVQEAHIFCHFQKCFSHLPLICCRQGGSRGSWFCHFQYCLSHLPHMCDRQGVHEAHGFCHFQYCFSHLPHMWYRQGCSGCSCLSPLSIMFQSFTTRVL
jgi:hypothetical protein